MHTKNILRLLGEMKNIRSVIFLTVKRGDIYYADLSPVVGSEQGGIRPVLIVQNDVGNKYSPTVIAAAITSQKDNPSCLLISPFIRKNVVYPKIQWYCWNSAYHR